MQVTTPSTSVLRLIPPPFELAQTDDYVSVGSSLDGGYLTGDRGSDSLEFEGILADTSVWGGSSADTTNDGADYVTFALSTTNAYVQLNAGADTLLASKSLTQSTLWGGADGDSISLTASSQSEIDGQAGNDTLELQLVHTPSPPSVAVPA